ncbi:MAG TPA: hypothetical protein VMV44_15570 [Rectinemataceae bacterium]|nr:hypothetical protein [Rectinemataceae bacterium]
MPTIQYRIEVRRKDKEVIPPPLGYKWSWAIYVSTNRRGTFISSVGLASKAEAVRIARTLFRLNREPDISLKGLAQWVEER